MAVNGSGTSTGRHLAVGLNVGLMIVLAVALVVGLQYIGYTYSVRADWTASGVNSLSEGTRRLLQTLDVPVRVTSLYFRTDLEDEDQSRFRKTVDDLVGLYQATNRGKIAVDTVNPLQEQDKVKTLLKRLADLNKFKEQAAGHNALIDAFRGEIAKQMTAVLSADLGELDAITSQLEGVMAAGGTDARLTGQVKDAFEQMQKEMDQTLRDVDDALASDVPALDAAIGSIRNLYTSTGMLLDSITKVGGELTAGRGSDVSPTVKAFFVEADNRYRAIRGTIQQQQDKLKDLPTLQLEEITRQLTPTGNAIVVESDADARIVNFSSIWPPLDPSIPTTGFKDSQFLGEQKLTAAILQLTQQRKPAVVFVRFGGGPLFVGGYMPGQGPAPFERMKASLEDVNFTVHEWDLSGQEGMPKIDPPPSRQIFVVLPPEQPRNPFAQPQPPRFGPEHLAKLKQALGDKARAVFLAGYEMSSFGMPEPYAYQEYLRDNWGINVLANRLLLQMKAIAPGKYRLERDPVGMDEMRYAQNAIVAPLGKSRTMLTWAAPLDIAPTPPTGVTLERLAWLPKTEGLWSVGDLDFYRKQLTNEFIVRAPDDSEGEFTVAAAASKGEEKVAVISSRAFAADQIALAQEWVLTAQGVAVRPRNPGNVTLMVNTLYWLDDNTEWMSLGSPVDLATLSVERDSSAMTAVRMISWIGLPGLAACAGLVMWWVRRS